MNMAKRKKRAVVVLSNEELRRGPERASEEITKVNEDRKKLEKKYDIKGMMLLEGEPGYSGPTDPLFD
jgi:hypothetical protein